MCSQAADREILDGHYGLDAELGIGRHLPSAR